MLFTGILAWFWLEMYLSKRHLPWILDPVGFVLWKLGVGNWELCLLCISLCLTDVSLDLLPHRFPFCQALAEALKTNTSVTSIDLNSNSIGDEGVKAFCVSGFQVVPLLILGVEVQILLTLIGPEGCWGCWWCGMMWYDLVCFLLGYWHDIGMILAGSASLCQRHLPWIQWELLFGNSESESRKLRVVSPLYFMRSHRCPFGQALAEALKKNTSVTSMELWDNFIGDEGAQAFCVPGFQVAVHGVSAYSWCWGSDSDPDWRVLRVLRASTVGGIIVPSSTAHSQALEQMIEERKKMGFELDIEF